MNISDEFVTEAGELVEATHNLLDLVSSLAAIAHNNIHSRAASSRQLPADGPGKLMIATSAAIRVRQRLDNIASRNT